MTLLTANLRHLHAGISAVANEALYPRPRSILLRTAWAPITSPTVEHLTCASFSAPCRRDIAKCPSGCMHLSQPRAYKDWCKPQEQPLLISLLNVAPPLKISYESEETPPVGIEPSGRFDGRYTLRPHAMGTSIANRAVRSGAA